MTDSAKKSAATGVPFKPGHPKMGGRQKGVGNKKPFKDELLEAWEEIKGDDCLQKCKEIVNPNSPAPASKLLIAACVFKAIKNGDMRHVNDLFDRMFGKVKDKVEHSGIISTIDHDINNLDPKIRKAMIDKLEREILEDQNNS